MIKLSVIGNLGADAEVREHNGRKFVSFRVAHTEKYNEQEHTMWVSCVMNGDGGNLLPYLTRGTKVYVHGDFSVRLYRYNGEVNAGLNLNVREIELCGSRQQQPQEQQQHEEPAGQQANDVPF